MIEYDLPQSGQVTIEVFNLLGQRVRTLVHEYQQAGYRSALWDGRNEAGGDVASGVYFYRIEAGDFSSVKRMTLVR
jgi:flagellar hook assembly protein FlgD